jgi:peptide chain release factor subunit 1
MTISGKEKHELKKFLKNLELFKGRHTELVTVYVPEGYDLNKVINQLIQEKGTATNIKSTSTRKNVIDSLERMIQHLKLFKSTPPHGLAAFAGNIAEREGMSDVEVWSIEPPEPLRTRIYRCDKEFVLDPLLDMLESKDIYGLVVMDRREGNIAILKGKSIIPLVTSTSNVPGKTRAGGQSSQRFQRLREGAAKEFYNRLGEHMKDQFLHRIEDVKGIIVGGPGPTKYDWVDGNFITNEVKKKIIAIKDITYTGDFGLGELLDASQDVLAKEDVANEKKLMNMFFEHLAKKPGMVNYGVDHVMENLKMGVVDILLISDTLDEDKIEEMEAEAQKTGTKVEIISTETREGAQLKDLGKVAAILRYEVNV